MTEPAKAPADLIIAKEAGAVARAHLSGGWQRGAPYDLAAHPKDLAVLEEHLGPSTSEQRAAFEALVRDMLGT